MSRMMMLQSFTTPSNFKTFFDYHGSTGLLRSKEDSTGRAYAYNFDEYGRLTEAVTPSGQIIKLMYNLSVKGASVTITRNDKDPMSLLIKGSDVTKRLGATEERIMQHPDGSLTTVYTDSSKVDVETVPNPVLSGTNPVSSEMFPVPARVRIAWSDDNFQYLEWHYFVHAEGKSTDRRITRVGRKFKKNGDLIFTVVFDRENNAEVIYDRHQVPLVTATYDINARSIQWQSPQNITSVKISFDQFGRLNEWHRGRMKRRYEFDIQGRIVELKDSDNHNGIMYKYDKKVVDMPSELILPSGSRYTLQYDTAGGLHAVITPNGHKHELAMQTSLGFYKFLYLSPGIKYPYVLHFNDGGQVLAKLYPENNGRVVYIYDTSRRLKAIFCGQEKTLFQYLDQKTLIKTAIKTHLGCELRSDFRYHGTLLREERIRITAKPKFNNVKFKYKYESQFNIVEIDIGGKIIADIKYRYNGQTGALEQIQQFLVHRPKVNNVFIQDDQRQFSKTIGLDSYGFIALLAVTIWNAEVFSMTILYDERGKVYRTQTKIGSSVPVETTNYTYTPDGFLSEVSSSRHKNRYLYDANGNMNSIWNDEQRITIRYDEGDRPISFNDEVTYVVDSRGFIINRGTEKFTFNAKSQLIYAVSNGLYAVSYYYDTAERLFAFKDHDGNVTQFFYTDIKHPNRITHVHFPATRTTQSLFYDTNGHLIYMMEDTSSHKYFIASDYTGSPIAVFNSDGKIVKKILRSPFGEIQEDSNPALLLYVDFWGGIRDPYTQLLFLDNRLYDSKSAQFLVPNWEEVPKFLHNPFKIHLYRFRNNDPISPLHRESMIGLPKWLSSFGYNMENYPQSPLSNQYQLPNGVQKFPESLPVISGLSCSAEVVMRHFSRLSNSPLPTTNFEGILKPQLANLPSVLGDGLLMSTSQGRALVHILSDASPILRDVMTEVLNDTDFVNVYFSTHGQDSFHLVQQDQKRVQEDWDQLQRLGTMFNVTMHAGDSHVDLRLRSPALLLNIRYGGNLNEEKKRLIRHARRKAVDEAWQQEANAIRSGRPGSKEWTAEETRELLEKGMVTNYFGTNLHDTDNYPQLADDPTSVIFQKLEGSSAYTDV